MARLTKKGAVRIRDFSEPLQSQRETTSYGERLMHVAVFDHDPLPLGFDVVKYENEMIRTWREMAKNPYVDFAVDDVVNEMLAADDQEVYPIDIDLSGTKFSKNIQNKIHEEFINVQKLLEFNKKAYGLLRDWFIDGRAYYFVQFTKNGKDIESITPMDPVRTKRIITDSGESVFIYQDIDLTQTILEIPANQMIDVYSGLMDDRHQIWVSYLNKAFVPLNQLNSIEDALVIYRLTRAPERRVFYVDVGELPKAKAEAYMRDIINNYRNRMEYDSATGTVREKVRHMALTEDIWLARRDGTRGTEVSVLPAGANLGELSDLEYFLRKLFRSLNIPYSRWGGDNMAANVMGRATEITRDEVKYSKFISRLRTQYNSVFYIILRSLLHIKKIVKDTELDEERENIIFRWNTENMFFTFKRFDIMNERANMLDRFLPLMGKLVSIDWIRREILGQSDEDIREIDKAIENEVDQMKRFAMVDQGQWEEDPTAIAHNAMFGDPSGTPEKEPEKEKELPDETRK